MKVAFEYLKRHLPEGAHETTIGKVDSFVPNGSAKEFVRIRCVDEDGRSAEPAFSLGENALWRAAEFLVHCGLSDEDLRHFDLEELGHYQCLEGRRVKIHVEYKDHRDEVTEYPVVFREEKSEHPQPAFDRSVLPKVEFVEASQEDEIPY